MKIRTSIRAGGSGCSPETQYYMQQAVAMQAKVQSCLASQAPSQPPTGGYYPPYYGTYPPYYGSPTYPTTPTTGTYPDMSGTCG